MPKRYGQSCPVARSLEFLGERWTLLIVRDLLMGPKKFQDFSGLKLATEHNFNGKAIKLTDIKVVTQ